MASNRCAAIFKLGFFLENASNPKTFSHIIAFSRRITWVEVESQMDMMLAKFPDTFDHDYIPSSTFRSDFSIFGAQLTQRVSPAKKT
jgi:hypothetical protein